MQNLGSPAPELGVSERWLGNLVVRPWGEVAMLGLDVEIQDEGAPGPRTRLGGSLRLQPREGLVVRLSGDQDLRIGAGFETYFGKSGMGAFAALAPDADLAAGTATVYGVSSQDGEHVRGSARKVPEFVFEGPFSPTSRSRLSSPAHRRATSSSSSASATPWTIRPCADSCSTSTPPRSPSPRSPRSAA